MDCRVETMELIVQKCKVPLVRAETPRRNAMMRTRIIGRQSSCRGRIHAKLGVRVAANHRCELRGDARFCLRWKYQTLCSFPVSVDNKILIATLFSSPLRMANSVSTKDHATWRV